MSQEMRTLVVLVVAGCVIAIVARVRGRIARRTRAGINVVGYVDTTGGLGERARELAACLRAAGAEVSVWPATGTDRPPPVRAATVAVVTAVQLASVRQRVPEPFEHADRTIGYFFWELAEVPEEQQWGIGLVDEIWAPTEFVRRAYADATDTPVQLAPIPISDPSSAGPSGDDDVDHESGVFTFLTSFDHLSVMERKNPIAAIDAFRRIFPPDEHSVRLLVKTINGDRRPEAAERLRAAAAPDPRIEVRDERLDPAGLLALIDRADAFVSLHRSEGLGLHLAEAMWLGTPVIATGYSGNLDFMDERSAGLVRHSMVPVRDGDGAYPETSSWAEPDVEHASELMRRMVDDDEWRSGLAVSARERMASQPSRAEAGAGLLALLGAAGPR